MVNRTHNRKGIAFIDWDYTLTTFEHEKARDAVHELVQTFYGSEVARFVRNGLDYCFFSLLGSGRGSESKTKPPHARFSETWSRVFEQVVIPRSVPEVTSLRWSREIMFETIFRLLTDQTDTSALVTNATNYRWQLPFFLAKEYWKTVASEGQSYRGASEFLSALRQADWQIVYMSSTDGRLMPRDNETGGLVYDPGFSRQQKILRLKRSTLIFHCDEFAIGDPIGKPNPRFWRGLVDHYKPTSNERILVMGDSYNSDIKGVRNVIKSCVTIVVHGATMQKKDVPECSFIANDLPAALNWLRNEKIL